MIWFTGENFGDCHKKDWKRVIKRKGSNIKNKKNARRKVSRPDYKITTVFFVPQSRKSWLFKEVRQVEDLLKKDCSWGVKVLEQPGSPLLNQFFKKFPIIHGCPRADECCICGNEGLKCSPKSVVYSGTCMQCKDTGGDSEQVLNDSLKDLNHGEGCKAVYIGETSRPWRDRICEHLDKARNLKTDSVIVQHWAEHHGTQITCPAFEFKILNKFKIQY